MLKDKLVLLVDDEPSILSATRAGLLDRGFHVEAVGGAEDAIRVIRALKPSIVVSDLVMPGTNGFELFETVKKEHAGLPFIFLTAVDDYYARKFGREMGGAAYITKPVDLDELERIILEKIGA
jgi:DNA-binding response OmpR family regulator